MKSETLEQKEKETKNVQELRKCHGEDFEDEFQMRTAMEIARGNKMKSRTLEQKKTESKNAPDRRKFHEELLKIGFRC